MPMTPPPCCLHPSTMWQSSWTTEGLFIDRQALRDSLTSFSGAGMTGGLACDAFGDCGSQEIQIVIHEDSSITDSTQLPVVFTFKGEIS